MVGCMHADAARDGKQLLWLRFVAKESSSMPVAMQIMTIRVQQGGESEACGYPRNKNQQESV